MSWIWNFLAGIGRMSRNAWNESSQQAREAELRRMIREGRPIDARPAGGQRHGTAPG